jgi:tRNA(Ile)-lysidine synthase
MPSPIEEILTQFLLEHRIRDARLLVGVSGGVDSVSLLRGLMSLAGRFGIELVAGHFDHGLRKESARDAEWVDALCQRLGIRCVVGRDEVHDESSVSGGGREPTRFRPSEETSRNRRYDFLGRMAEAEGCRWLAIAHTADDQAETVLHHILRGTGLKGLAGIPARRALSQNVELIRPFLLARRSDLLAELARLDQSFLTDETNRDCGYTRNRLRNELLPRLRQDFNPQVDAALVRLAAQSAEASALIGSLACELLTGALLDRHPQGARLLRSRLCDQPPVLVREAIVHLWEIQNWSRQPLSARHVDRLLQMVISGSPDRLSLPAGLEARSRDEILELRMR